ncbi:winged helix-turn-helix domain-containing protein [Micromonospora sp. NBC_01699]|uniref:BTAD domain-containing putative transcriptional regulator n=1 Tax=Micromonospora sp. NBC_01699 TaxID=2975984 RepID=UPI002E36F49B|nr:BTAD domain-containing putative transcriptional regulator [Micromonospora sp. NBC_01699]
MRYGILGPTRVLRTDGEQIAVGGARLRALLTLLLVDAGRVVSVPRLIDGLYGETPPHGAANALQSQVSRLRQTLPGPDPAHPLVEFHRSGYRIAVEPDQVDAFRFDRLATAGRAALSAGDRPRAAALLREALALWRGEPLADIADTPAGRAHAARLDEQRLDAVEDRIDAELGLPDRAPPIGELRELVAAQPLRERLRALLMRALYEAGRPAEALHAYEDARRTLADELGADPSAELAAVHLAVLRADRAPTPAPATRAGLPGQLTSFVGREEELRRVGKLLDEARLVTLTGPGGAGKTRLAIEAAGHQQADVCFVELAAASPGTNLAQAVLGALGLRDAGLRAPAEHRRDTTDRLVAALTDRPLLLVLDNCEHVVAEAARLTAALLHACPRLRILTTSREPLRLTGEALCPVTGLALPPQQCGPADARDYPAVRLFAERAVDVAPDFAITAANVDAVLRICRTLDGLPLAIELAAARLRTLPAADIAARLDDRFRLLTRGSRTALPRHRTLRAAVEWSWDLLEPTERVLARRLTVFTGGATVESAEGVCGLPDHDLVEVLAGLVDKSLVEVHDGRYRMLDTVRAYGAERLAEAGEADRLHRAHADWFLAVAQTADPHLRRSEQLDWLRRLDAERDNLHAALRRATREADPGTALRLVAALSFYWWLRGLRGEAATRAEEVLDTVGAEPPPGLTEEYALCLLNAALGNSSRRQPPIGLNSAEWVRHTLGRPPRQPFLLFLSAMASGPPTDGAEAMIEMIDENGGLLGADPWVRALTSVGLGLTWLFNGQVERSEIELDRALRGLRDLGDRWGTVLALTATAELASGRGDHPASLASLAEALPLAEQLGSTVDIADLLRTRGDVRIHAGDLAGAYADFLRSGRLARQAGAPELGAAARLGLAEVARLRGDLTEARELCDAALSECPLGWFGAAGTRVGILVTLGRIAELTEGAGAARVRYGEALTTAIGLASLPPVGGAVDGLVRLQLDDADPARAAVLLGAVTALLAGVPVAGATELTRIEERTRARLGDAVYVPSFASGAALSRDQALRVVAGR